MPYKNREDKNAADRASYSRHRDRVLKRQKKYNAENKVTRRAVQKQWETKNRTEYDHDGHLKRKYGISTEQYDAMLMEQGGHCALCPRTQPAPNPKVRRFSVDHDHGTGRTRRLLCQWCNTAIGFLNDDPTLLREAANYVEFFRLVPSNTTIKRRAFVC
jgi:hypothetical protein